MSLIASSSEWFSFFATNVKVKMFDGSLFPGLNITISVLIALGDSLLAITRWIVSFKSLLIWLLIFLSNLSTRRRLKSFAKWWTELNSTAFRKSLMNTIKRRGPKTKLCITAYLTNCLAEWQPWILVNCFQSSRNDWKHLLAISPNSIMLHFF